MAKKKLNMLGEYSHMSAHLNSSPRRKKLRQALQLADTDTTQSIPVEELTAQEKEVKEPTEIFS
jgi:Ca2+-binding EF-hand superfamily protein